MRARKFRQFLNIMENNPAPIKPKHPGGRPKGRRNSKTLIALEVKRLRDQRILGMQDMLIDAQTSLARGQQFLYRIDKQEIVGPKGGKSYRNLPPKLVVDEWEIRDYLDNKITNGNSDDESDPSASYYYMTTKEPVNQAIDSLNQSVFGRPKESIDLNTNVKFSLKNLGAARKHLQNETKTIDAQIIENDI